MIYSLQTTVPPGAEGKGRRREMRAGAQDASVS